MERITAVLHLIDTNYLAHYIDSAAVQPQKLPNQCFGREFP
jgi:hypothetical protein